jgi:uncharacterized protein YkwD
VAHRPSRLIAVMLASGMLACSWPASPDGRDDSGPQGTGPPAEVATAVVELTNAERARAGLGALRANARLMQAAQIHAEQMARAGRLDHVLPDATYPRPEDRLVAAEYRWQAYAENVAFGQRTAAEVVNGWMQSSGHRANIMNASYTEMGVGYARDPSARPYWVQVFGLPLS